MAKRKRLAPPNLESKTESIPEDLEAKSFPRYPMGVHPPMPSRPPIAQVAGDAASQAALEDIAAEVKDARDAGRIVTMLHLSVIKADYLIRDRMVMDATEMQSLKASLSARGQQTPIEVVGLGQGAYGLISGYRRLAALDALHTETGEARFAEVQALIKPIKTASDSYIAMVEENEIRANLSFYERAKLVAEAVEIGLYPSVLKATAALFAHTTPAKRSKIGSFVVLHEALGDLLRFPTDIPEKVGLALVTELKRDPKAKARIRASLTRSKTETLTQERAVLERALKADTPKPAVQKQQIAPGIMLEAHRGRVVLSGKGVTAELQQALLDWFSDR